MWTSTGTRSVARWGAVALALAAGCRSVVPIVYQVEPTPAVVGCPASGCAPADEQVEVTYLGVGGFMVRYRGRTLLTAPFFTNPPLADVAPPSRLRVLARRGRRIRSDTALIDRLLPRAADSASMILVGHSHYDHLMDVPWIATRRARGAAIVGSPTMRHILMGDSLLHADSTRLVALAGADVGDVSREGRWVYSADGAFRVMAVVAEHAPTVALFGRGPLFAEGTLDAHRQTLPEWADQWKAGEQLAYLIDVLRPGDARPRLRLYFEDAPNVPPAGFPPRSALAARGVDVALLCAATAGNVPGVPDRLLSLVRPSYVVVGHWESFFRPQTLPIVLNPATDADGYFRARGRALPPASGWQMPLPRTTIRFDLRPPS